MTIEDIINEYFIFDRPQFYVALEKYSKTVEDDLPSIICRINQYLRRTDKNDEILEILNSTKVNSPSHALAFLFYYQWFMYDVRNQRQDEAVIIIKKMESYINDQFPVYLKAEFYLSKAQVLDSEEGPIYYKKGLSLLPKESYRFKLGIKTLFDQFSKSGRLEDLEADYFRALPLDFNHVFSFINAVENGQTEAALLLKEKILIEKAELPEPSKIRLENSMDLLDLYLGKKSEKKSNHWMLPTLALLDKDLPLALTTANEFYNNLMSQGTIITNFGMFTLIRAQLANKNLDAAKLIINSWDKNDAWLCYADFFKARMELLNNNPEMAVQHFTAVLQYCKKNNSMGRLDFELELALELQPKQIRFLMDRANQNLDKKIEEKTPSPATKPNSSAFGINRIIGSSSAIKAIKEDIKKYADLDISVLILGETGVGKDIVANAIHEESKRKGEPFIAINCSSIAEGLLQSELFGHEVGSYTGASKAHKGIFQEAGNGTVFLDEIGDISSGLQAALLRALESGEYRPVGSAKSKIFKCRIIAATNALLEQKVDAGVFRLDLMYRLKRLVIQIPPLRERPLDITQLANYFLNLNKSFATSTKIDQDLEEALIAYPWPGNVRELKNEMEKMRLLHSGKSTYSLEDAPFLLDRLKNNMNKKAEVSENKQSSLPVADKKPVATNEEILQNSGSYFRRIEAIKKLFAEHKNLSRKEICQITGLPDLTIGRYIKTLREENFILKIEPTKSPRTHYFTINS